MLSLKARERIADITLKNRGGTFDAVTGKPYEPDSGYAVAVEPVPTTGGIASRNDIIDRLGKVYGRPDIPYVGTWVTRNAWDNDVVYIDRVVIVPDLESALIFARAMGEQAVYEFASGDSIDVRTGDAIDDNDLEVA